MKTETNCPSCKKGISIWRIMSAVTPFHLSCGSCGQKLRVKGWTIPALIIAIILGFVLGIAIFQIAGLSFLSGTGVLMAIIASGEFVASLLIINRGTLVPANAPTVRQTV